MSGTEAVVVDANGLTFNVTLEPATSAEDGAQVLVRLDDGTRFLVPQDLLLPQGDGRYRLKVGLQEYAQRAASDSADESDESVVISLAEEVLSVGKRSVARARVQVSKRVLEREETVDLPLQREQLEVERISINRVVDEPLPVRYEGDTTVIPLFEEVLVVSKQLMLVEEVRVTKRRLEHHEPQQVLLRREEAVVERTEAESE